MRRVMYVFLPRWPIDRLRQLAKKRGGSVPNLCSVPADTSLGEPPFATVTAAGGRRLIAALNPAAEKAGLAPGMPLPDALSFLPGLATIPADPAADAAALTRLAEWCSRYSPWTAPDFQTGGETDGVKIEITGSAHLWGGEAALAADLSRRLTRQNIAHRIAIASTLGAAWALARYTPDDGHPVLPAPPDERATLAPLPIEALRLDPDIVQGLRRVGLRHVGELYPMPRDALARRFGDAVARRLDQVSDNLPEPLSPLGETPSRRVRLSFPEPIADPADLARATLRLVEDLTERLAREGMGARRLALGFHRVDGRVEHIRIGTARPSRDPRHLAKLFTEKLDQVDIGGDPGLGIEDMILALFAADPLPAEQHPLPNPPPHPKNPLPPSGGEGRVRGACDAEIASLLDRLGNRFGLDAISHIAPRASHIPERASINASLGDGKVSFQSGSQKSPRGRARPDHPRLEEAKSGAPGTSPSTGIGNFGKPPRPVRLFRPPEPVEAQWVLPDDPPFRFHWRRVWHRVRHADGPERIAEEWWLEGGPVNREADEAVRDYYRVEDEEGRRFWLYRAGLPGINGNGGPPPRWFVHGLFA